VFPVMDCVIDVIKAGDGACVELGVEFIEFGGKQPFGRTLHGNTARAPRCAVLTTEQVARRRRQILAMLVAGEVPHGITNTLGSCARLAWARAGRKLEPTSMKVMRT
jgi:hypothetical protein